MDDTQIIDLYWDRTYRAEQIEVFDLSLIHISEPTRPY